jgi:hypothetical protein
MEALSFPRVTPIMRENPTADRRETCRFGGTGTIADSALGAA